jgi:alkyldihydroxyacetonephosphate synthase
MKNPLDVFREFENLARDETLVSGGTISHHHDIGKVRAKWYKQSVSDFGVELHKSTKKELDLRNIFVVENILTSENFLELQQAKL